MSIEAMNWALNQQTGSPAAKSVLLILANRADHRGICWPGITGIARQTELSRRAVIDNLKRLESDGLLTVTKRANPLTNVYLLAMLPSAGGALVQELHGAVDALDSAADALELVQEVHLPSAGGAPKPSLTITKPKVNPKRTKRAPKDFELDASLRAFAKQQGMNDEQVESEFSQLKDHEYKDGRSDWPAAWRTWCRNWKKWSSVATSKKKLSYAEQLHADMAAKGMLSDEPAN